MSALSIVQDHCRIHALAIPTSIISSTDTQTNQLLGILNEVISDIIVESKYQVVTLECVHILSAGENQGPVENLGSGLFGYYQANFETFYDRTLRRPLYGPLTDTEWQAIKAIPDPGPFYKFRIWQNCLYINPAPAEPFSVIAFEYMSSFGVQASDGTPKASVTADNDTFALPEHIIRKWLMFRWKQIKGLSYQADETRAYDMLNNYIARDKVKRRVNVANTEPEDLKPGIFVPSGNWPVNN